MRLEDTEEYRRGRNGEIIIHSFLVTHGFTAFDIGGTAHGSAPMLNSLHKNTIAPDALLIGNFPILGEFKTKTNPFDWNGGSQEMNHHIPPCLAHGIERRAFIDYREANKQAPLVLFFLTINTGALHAASLDELGEPWPSVNDRYDIVNWPLSSMARIVSFDHDRLWQFFRRERRHDGLPNIAERRELVDWLRPRQLEIDPFITHFLKWREQHWVHQNKLKQSA